jgi:hypothetical protein
MIDTHKYYLALKGAGFDDRQAEALTSAFGDAVHGSLATKADIAELRVAIGNSEARLQGEIGTLGAELRGEMATMREELRGELKGAFQRMFLQISAVMMLLFSLAEYANRHIK